MGTLSKLLIFIIILIVLMAGITFVTWEVSPETKNINEVIPNNQLRE